ncbi:DUF4259 domain-containing protein [Micromonospora sp. CPCC 205371]|nr:DUF4259 domain-containing protein [Micromonospora sp. CPCC 205371]
MGTFGTGPFASDGAMDFLEELAERSPERRAAALEHMFKFVKNKPELLWREFFPDEVVAGAAIVAASLPGGEPFAERLAESADDDVALDVRLPMPAPELAKAALEALLFVAGPEGPWHQGWTSEADAHEARNTINTMSLVLGEASQRP